ncbi:MAG TPA: 5-oxoprolinase subunit PxpA [Chitinophagaceae bacterium]|nr:5-oxoprolinase subunit PxpA [Chitinophagaceae bacterium]
MSIIDFNCDLGEGTGNDKAIMPYISSANIACGYHAGNETSMKETVELCSSYGVAMGAHPSFPDKENFGRTNMNLPSDEIYSLVLNQIKTLADIVFSHGKKLQHVKPHGALYNMAAKDISIARAVANAIKDFDKNLLLFGPPKSKLDTAANEQQIKFIAEAFADRTYQPDGSLTPRTQPNALIEDEEKCVHQVLQIIKDKTVTCCDGTIISLKAETICIHSDGKNAVGLTNALYKQLKESGIAIQSFN